MSTMGDENRLLMKTSIGGDYHWGWRSWTVGTHLVATIIGWWSWSMAITDECHLPMMVTDYLLSWLMNTTEWWLSLASDGHLLATIIHDKDLLMRIMVGDYHLWRLSLLVTITFDDYREYWKSSDAECHDRVSTPPWWSSDDDDDDDDEYHGGWEPLSDDYLMAIILAHHQWWVAIWVFHGHWMDIGRIVDGYCVYEEWESWSTLMFSDHLPRSLALLVSHESIVSMSPNLNVSWSYGHMVSWSQYLIVFVYMVLIVS